METLKNKNISTEKNDCSIGTNIIPVWKENINLYKLNKPYSYNSPVSNENNKNRYTKTNNNNHHIAFYNRVSTTN